MKEDLIFELETLCGEIKLSRCLSEIIFGMTDHAEGSNAAIQNGDYDRLSALTTILFERICDEADKFQGIIEEIYKEIRKEAKAKNGKV